MGSGWCSTSGSFDVKEGGKCLFPFASTLSHSTDNDDGGLVYDGDEDDDDVKFMILSVACAYDFSAASAKAFKL
jgi:hypothetical protein